MNFKARKATDKDLQLFYEWANDPDVRKNSFHSRDITFEEHSEWFKRKIDDPNVLMLIIEDEEGHKKVGQVRFEIGHTQRQSIISISIAREFRGKGLGEILLNLSADYYFQKNIYPVHAYIKKHNMASIKMFEKNGFKFSENISINGIDSGLWILRGKNDTNRK